MGAYTEDHNVAGGVELSAAGSAYIYTYMVRLGVRVQRLWHQTERRVTYSGGASL